MGLLQRKKRAVARKIHEQTHEIVCLSCFRRFPHERAYFRAPEVLDEVLNPDAYGEAGKGYHRGVLLSLTDVHGNMTTKRVCPYCHADLPQHAGFTPITVISVVGASRMDTAIYLTAMIHTIKTVTPRYFPVFCAPFSHDARHSFKQAYEDPLIENGGLSASAFADAYTGPFVFSLSFTDGNEVYIAYMDAPDADASDVYTAAYAAHMEHASAVILAIDPRSLSSVRKNGETDAVSRPGDPLSALWGIPPVPVAVTLTRTETLEALPEVDSVRKDSVIFSRHTHESFVDLNACEQIGIEAEALIRDNDPNLHNAVKRRFVDAGFFAVSALGAAQDAIRQHAAVFMPRRTEEPLLWLLYKLGYIEGRK